MTDTVPGTTGFVDFTSYLSFDQLFALVDEPLQASLIKTHNEYLPLFLASPGSRHNHHTWLPQGYLDHIQDCMNLAVSLYGHLSRSRPMGFTLSSALAVLYLHDVEKPFKYVRNEPHLETKTDRSTFRNQFVFRRQIPLTPGELRAINLVEGENEEYSPNHRVMSELAAFCHCCDVMSARIWFDFGASLI